MSVDPLIEAAGVLRPAYERVDWAGTPLGAMAGWSPALRNATDLALNTRFPVTLLWGPEFVLVYNEPYVRLIADKHPAALGMPARMIFPEAWDVIGPMLAGVLAGGPATWVEDQILPLERDGVLREAYFTFSYSGVRPGGGPVEGILDVTVETTAQRLDRRRLITASRLGALVAAIDEYDELAMRAASLLAENAADFGAVKVCLPGRSGCAGRSGPLPAGRLAGRDLVVEGGPRGRIATLSLGAAIGGGAEPLLVVGLDDLLVADERYLQFLRLIAAALRQANDRLVARRDERRAAATERRMSETLQRSLLTTPPPTLGLEVAVRYQPAAEQAQVGGDWHDVFTSPDGTLNVVIGDVAGHDQLAAAAMAQARNLLRGIAYAAPGSPARTLTALDGALDGLTTDVLATAVLGRVPRDEDGGASTLVWSNAGHPPPVLLGPDGSVQLLETEPDLLLGLGAPDGRRDHRIPLAPGTSVVLYTDGLVERRDAPITEGFAWLTETLRDRHDLGPDGLCELVMGRLEPGMEDDVALLVLRVG